MKKINNQATFDQYLNGDKPVLIDFYADWCPPCKMLTPVLEELSKEHQDDFEIIKVNVDEQEALAAQFDVRNIPTLVFIKDKKIQEKMLGFQSKHRLEQKINKYLAIA